MKISQFWVKKFDIKYLHEKETGIKSLVFFMS